MPGGACRSAPIFVLIASRPPAVLCFLECFPDAAPIAAFLHGQAAMSAQIPHATLVTFSEGEWEILAGGLPEELGAVHFRFLDG